MINYSIIIPHYNIPDLLGRCLKSIPERDDIQVIVVDDNSENNEKYLTTIPELRRKNVEFYVTRDGLGAGHARNIGLAHAKGKWIVFADSDDFFSEEFSHILNEYVDDTNDIIYFNIKMCDCYDTSKLFYVNKNGLFKIYEQTGDTRYFRFGYSEPWGKFYKHQFLIDNAIHFQETKANNDLLFSIKSGVLAENVRIENRILYWYVIRDGSLGHQKKRESFEKVADRVRAWNSTQQFLDSKGIKTGFYLPARPCLVLLQKDLIMLFKILRFMRSESINYIRVVYELFRHTFCKYIKGKGTIGVVRIFDGCTV